ncbi:MAG: acyl carrier protein [Anaerolineae bacterium]
MAPSILNAEEFCRLLARELQLEEDQVTLQAAFVDDLLVDSIRMVDLMLRLEEMGIAFPLEMVWEIRTVGDAYRCYVQAMEATGGAPAAASVG